MKSRIQTELNRELKNVKVSCELKGCILSAAAEERFPEKQKRMRLAPLAAAAAIIVICGLTLGMISLRTEKVDRRSNVLASGSGEWVWVSDSDNLYHSKSPCGTMSGAVRVRLELAKKDGRTPCGDCVVGTKYTPIPEVNAETMTEIVWVLGLSDCYHRDEHCSGMEGAEAMAFEEAIAMDMVACPTCAEAGLLTDGPVAQYVTGQEMLYTPVPGEGVVGWSISEQAGANDVEYLVWATKNGVYYHCEEHCSGMRNASAMTAEAAEGMGKTACPTCVGKWESVDVQPLTSPTPVPVEVTPEPTPKVISGGDVVWSTERGRFYHCDEHCSGMEGAQQMTFAEVINAGKSPCPVCFGLNTAEVTPEPTPMPTAEVEARLVWATEKGTYYHLEEHCCGMQGAQRRSLEEVMAMGKGECPVCFGTYTPVPADVQTDIVDVWATKEGKYYHTDRTCSGMQGADKWTLELAQEYMLPCPVCCAVDANVQEEAMTVWTVPEGTYYHRDQFCSGMQNAVECSYDDAVNAGKNACQVCFAEHESDVVFYETDG